MIAGYKPCVVKMKCDEIQLNFFTLIKIYILINRHTFNLHFIIYVCS